jgi:prepilin-type processing-associated H-X9-DG protein
MYLHHNGNRINILFADKLKDPEWREVLENAATTFRHQKYKPLLVIGIIIDFEVVIQSPHSFLNALLSSLIQEYRLHAYKKIKIKTLLRNK